MIEEFIFLTSSCSIFFRFPCLRGTFTRVSDISSKSAINFSSWLKYSLRMCLVCRISTSWGSNSKSVCFSASSCRNSRADFLLCFIKDLDGDCGSTVRGGWLLATGGRSLLLALLLLVVVVAAVVVQFSVLVVSGTVLVAVEVLVVMGETSAVAVVTVVVGDFGDILGAELEAPGASAALEPAWGDVGFPFSSNLGSGCCSFRSVFALTQASLSFSWLCVPIVTFAFTSAISQSSTRVWQRWDCSGVP
mmetsp:Transcript_29058/g.57045  ORF Transcript_29058/g.57045 Transcript_29058/m.57045 type:complete len:248 (-) Transcript_29058:333-1076(-)